MDTDIVIIGAGVIGLAIAQKVAKEGYAVVLLEKERNFGMGVSSRNSEVIHAGIYYQTESLKASLCLQGRKLLYKHCQKFNIPHKQTGKLFLAVTPEEIPRLEQSQNQAIANGVEDLVDLDQRQIRKLEPGLKGTAALFSPSSGIIDSHGFMKSLLGIAKQNNTMFAPLSPFEGAESIPDGWKIYIGGREPISIKTRAVINAAGLYAIELSKKVFPERDIPTLHPTKGSYIRYSGKSPLNHIVYPAIIPGQIEERVDATPDLGGSLRFGPNVETPKHLEDFVISPDLVKQFIPGIQRYLPHIDISRLHPDMAGIRPKIYGPGDNIADFRFDWAHEHGWMDLWGMESPALTASLAIAEYTFDLLQSRDLLN